MLLPIPAPVMNDQLPDAQELRWEYFCREFFSVSISRAVRLVQNNCRIMCNIPAPDVLECCDTGYTLAEFYCDVDEPDVSSERDLMLPRRSRIAVDHNLHHRSESLSSDHP